MKTGVTLIAIERRRQIEKGYTPELDDSHEDGVLSRAAICYIEASFWRCKKISRWPWSKSYWKPKDKLSNLVRAGAFIAAEIDRLQRTQ